MNTIFNLHFVPHGVEFRHVSLCALFNALFVSRHHSCIRLNSLQSITEMICTDSLDVVLGPTSDIVLPKLLIMYVFDTLTNVVVGRRK